MHIRRGKPIDSSRLKLAVNKAAAVQAAGEFSRAVPKGLMLDACPVCSGENSRDLAWVYGFLYRECQGCGSAHVANRPAQLDLEAVYGSAYYTHAKKILLANDQLIEYRVANIAEPKVAFVEEHLGATRKTWLDVGCGVGEILAAARRHGFEVLGLEANPMESEYARQKFGIDVRREYVTDESLKNKRDSLESSHFSAFWNTYGTRAGFWQAWRRCSSRGTHWCWRCRTTLPCPLPVRSRSRTKSTA